MNPAPGRPVIDPDVAPLRAGQHQQPPIDPVLLVRQFREAEGPDYVLGAERIILAGAW